MARNSFEAMEAKSWDDLIRNDAGTKQARQAMDAELILDLDTSVTLDQYKGLAGFELVQALATFGEINNAAWKLAFMSHLEAARLAQELGCYDDIGGVVDLIRWCRRAAGLAEEFPTARWGMFEKIKNPGEPGSFLSLRGPTS